MHNLKNQKLPKLIVLVGPTGSGKTEWSIALAKKCNGEIISADSRQIYQKMHIGTAKPKGVWKRNGLRRSYYVEGVVHHLMDFLDPGRKFSAAEFRDKAVKYAKLAYAVGRMPFLVGGTGLYIQAVVDNLKMPRVAPNYKLRRSFETKDTDTLHELLESMDPDAAQTIDPNNKRRVIRALEVCILSGEPFSIQRAKGEPLFDMLRIGINVDRETLDRRIDKRVDTMITTGLVEEIRNLLKQKYTWDLPSMSGIGYREFRPYFEGAIDLNDAIVALRRDTHRYARRQMAWFMRDECIKWCDTYEAADAYVESFLES